MAIGRNRSAGVPQLGGLTVQQEYRWAKLVTQWLRGWEDSTYAGSAGATTTSSTYCPQLHVSATTSAGESSRVAFQVRDAWGNSLNGRRSFRMWLADSTQGMGQNKSPAITMSVGTLLEKDGSMRWAHIATDTGGAARLRMEFGATNSAYVVGSLSHGRMYAESRFKLVWSVTSPKFYLWFSATAESANWVCVHIEARKSADNTRYQQDLTLACWFAGTRFGIAGNLAGVGFSGGCANLATLDSKPDVHWVRISSTGANIVKLNETGVQDWYVHASPLNGLVYAASAGAKADFS